jgi:hypothetical protein
MKVETFFLLFQRQKVLFRRLIDRRRSQKEAAN